MFQDELEQTERRRSSRIIALEEKKERERESKALAALAKKNNSANHDNRNKGKRKETTDVGDHFIDYYNEDDQHSPTMKKGRKCKALHQLISSSTQPMQEGQHPENGSTSRTNVSSLNGMPEKYVLELVLDLLQRKDPEELFAEPVNPNVVEDYYRIVKQPMDFGAMRAKLHEGMYTSMEQFKRDVYLMCTNAMNAYPANTTYHQVAEAIHIHARRVFEGLSAETENFELESSLNKRRPAAPGRKPKGGQPRTSRHAKIPPKPAGRNFGTHSTAPEIEKRDKYWPPNDKSLLSKVLNAPKPNIQLNKNAGNYEDSLLRFVEELGPTAQTVAAKRLEALKFKQLWNGETRTPNLLTNDSDTQIIVRLGPKAQTDAAKNLEALKFQQLFNGETPTPNLRANVSDTQITPQLGPTAQAFAAKKLEALKFQQLFNGETPTPNLLANVSDTRITPPLGPTAETVVAKKLEALKFQQLLNGETPTPNPLANVSDTRITPQPPTQPDALNNAHRLSLGLPLSNKPLTIPGAAAPENRNVNTIAGGVNISDGAYKGKRICVEDGWNACAAALLSNIFLNYNDKSSSELKGKNSDARGTIDIWGPSKDKLVAPVETVSSLLGPVQEGTNQNRKLQLGAGKTGQWNTCAGIPDYLNKYMSTTTKDVSGSSSRVRTQVWPTRVISGPQPKPLESISRNNLLELSFFPNKPTPADSIYGSNNSGLSLVSQPKPADSMFGINDPGLSLVSQPKPADSMFGINDSGLSLVSQPKPADSMFGINDSGLSLVSQPKPADFMFGINDSGLSLVSQPKPADSMSGMNIPGLSLFSQLKLAEPESMSGNNPSRQSVLPSQAANFAKWNEPDTSLYGLSTPYQPGDFQALLGPTDHFNNSPYPAQATREQVLNQATPYIPPLTNGFPDLQMQLGRLNPLGPFPQQAPKSSSAPEMPLGNAMDYCVGRLQDQPEEATPLLLWDDDQQPNLALQL